MRCSRKISREGVRNFKRRNFYYGIAKGQKICCHYGSENREEIGGKVRNVHVAEIHEEPMPEMGPKDVMLKMETCQICTTDYQHWLGLREHQGFPMAGDHEWSGNCHCHG